MPHSHNHQHADRFSSAILNAEQVLDTLRLGEGTIFLDIGCGNGFISLAASKRVGRVIALDADAHAIELVKKSIERKQIKNVAAVHADATRRLPLDDSSVTVALMANVMHGFIENNETTTVLPELVRVIEQGGVLAIVEFKTDATIGPPKHVRVDAGALTGILVPYGFTLEQIENVGRFHYCAIFTLG